MASKWREGGEGGASFGPREEQHQTILNACNFQAVLAEGISMDHEIAWKGSICTEREKIESERRLSLVKRALLRLALAFVQDHKKNQKALFEHMGTLQALATPIDLQDGTRASKIFDERVTNRQPSPFRARSPGGNASIEEINLPPNIVKGGNGSKQGKSYSCTVDHQWPFTVPELAQALIIGILRRNEELCDHIQRPLIELFASLVDRSDDCSAAPTLDLLFILIQPHKRPIFEKQTALTEILLNRAFFPNLAQAVREVVKLPSDDSEEAWANSARLVRLVRAVMENKHEYTASQLMQHANLSIDATCNAIVDLVGTLDVFIEKTVDSNIEKSTENKSLPTKDPAALSKQVLTGELGRELVSLLAEQVLLLPMNALQVLSQPLWRFIEGPAALTLEALTNTHCLMCPFELQCCENLFDVIEHVFFMSQRLGLDILSNPAKAVAVNNISDDVQSIMGQRELTPDFLRQGFVNAMRLSGNKVGLDREQFTKLVIELEESNQDITDANSPLGSMEANYVGSLDGLTNSATAARRIKMSSLVAVSAGVEFSKALKIKKSAMLSKGVSFKKPIQESVIQGSALTDTQLNNRAELANRLGAAFDLADSDGNHLIDLYEFIGLYLKVYTHTHTHIQPI